MKPRRSWLLPLLVALLLLVPWGVSHAQGPVYGDKVIVGGQFTLESGAMVRGDVVVFGGVANLQSDSLVTGDVVVIGGRASIDGTIEGDIAVIGGLLSLGPNAIVAGDALEIGGKLEKDPSAIIHGNIVHGFEFGNKEVDGVEVPLPQTSPLPPLPEIAPNATAGVQSAVRWFMIVFLKGLSAVATAALLAALGILLVLLAPQPTQRVRQTARERPLVAMAVGLLTVFLLIPIFAVLLITICLTPLALGLAFVLFVAMLMGWLAAGWELGARIGQALKIGPISPVTEVLVGVVILTLLWRLPLVVPLLGGLISWGVGLVVGSVGLGAVIMSRFGTQVYPPSPEDVTLAPLLPDSSEE
ncbi:MAG: polymer-forming cytoskeletal protein [Chloroflexi bacterium]|nr:polymer-forming cytoskeletal protein [Chloroflexota bacterium]